MKGYRLLSFRTTEFSGSVDPEKMAELLSTRAGSDWQPEGKTEEGDRTWFYFTKKDYLLILLCGNGQLVTMLLERDASSP